MSLWSRLTQPAEGEEKIAIHHFTSFLKEWEDGADPVDGVTFDRAGCLAAFNIADNAQGSGQLDVLASLYVAATDKKDFMRVLKNVLYLAEGGIAYTSANDAVTRLTGI